MIKRNIIKTTDFLFYCIYSPSSSGPPMECPSGPPMECPSGPPSHTQCDMHMTNSIVGKSLENHSIEINRNQWRINKSMKINKKYMKSIKGNRTKTFNFLLYCICSPYTIKIYRKSRKILHAKYIENP